MNPMQDSYFIISAYLSSEDLLTNQARHLALMKDLLDQGLQCYSVTGAYEGVPEQAFIVPLRQASKSDISPFTTFSILAEDYHQESVLVVSSGLARLAYTNGKTVPLGRLNLIAEDNLGNCKSYFKFNNICYSAG